MSEEMEFFVYLLEQYASYQQQKTGDIFARWKEKAIVQTIYDNYWLYHTEAIENAFADIDSLMTTGKYAW